MAVTAIKFAHELADENVLAPERYDPRRETLLSSTAQTISLGQLVASSRETVTPRDSRFARCLVLDTSHASDGLVSRPAAAGGSSQIGSNKKLVHVGDVIISRLRPYLRQVGWIDLELAGDVDNAILCSTEFFVLRSVDASPIAFLVPFLLTDAVQHVLAAAQEGGHHPRFSERTLLDLPVLCSLVARRKEVSESVAAATADFRRAIRTVQSTIKVATNCEAASVRP